MVVIEGTVRDFDKQENVCRPGMGSAVGVGARRQDHEVGLGLVIVVEVYRVLHAGEEQTIGDGPCESLSKPHRDRGVRAADRIHVVDFSVDEFDALGRRQDAGPGHAVVLADVEAMLRRGQRTLQTSAHAASFPGRSVLRVMAKGQ